METQFTFLVELAKQYNRYVKEPQQLYQAMNALPRPELLSVYADYNPAEQPFQPVNLLRSEVARRLLDGEQIDEQMVEELKERIRNKDVDYFSHLNEEYRAQFQSSKETTRDIFADWKSAWRLFHVFIYRGEMKKLAQLYLQQIAMQLRQDLHLNDYEIHYVDFQGSTNFGTDWAWLALYPLSKKSHRDSHQFFVRFAAQPEAGSVVGRSLGTEADDQLVSVNAYTDVLNKFRLQREEIVAKNEAIRNYFKFAPGAQAAYWESFHEQGIAALNYSKYDVGDLRAFSSLPELNRKAGLSEDNNSNQTWNMWLLRNARPGDVLFANQGVDTVIGIGVVTGEYYYDDSVKEFRHKIAVDWFANKVFQYKTGQIKGQKTLFRRDTFSPTNVWPFILSQYLRQYPEYKEEYIKYDLLPDGDVVTEPSTEDELVEILGYGGSDDTETSFWWLNANPNIWSISGHNVGVRQTYTTHNEKGNKRRVYRYFEAVKPGDLVIGYESSPVKQVKALIEITKGIHQSETEGEVIEFEILEKYDVPVHWNELQNNPALSKCEVLLNNQGSLFQLTEDEFDIIREVIDTKNILVEQQQQQSTTRPYSYSKDPDKPFISEQNFQEAVELLRRKKNIILQGPPGVGKTFIAKKLAYQIMQQRNDANIETIQFHQSYSYEDFIQGLRPTKTGFELKNGTFYTFCQKAHAHPERQFFFIIDEINRGNLSKIFGELMLLIEADKRDKKWAAKLTYAEDEEDRFFVPENLHIIGTMNTADRSLAIVDYALRRRFAFINLEPNFDQQFSEFSATQGLSPSLIAHIQRTVHHVNQQIIGDDNLGSGFQIGHSYFCTYQAEMDENRWYHEVIHFEIKPLLEEIWFDNLAKVKDLVNHMSR